MSNFVALLSLVTTVSLAAGHLIFHESRTVHADGVFSTEMTDHLILDMPSSLPIGYEGEKIILPVPGAENVVGIVSKIFHHREQKSLSMFGSIGGNPDLGSFSMACKKNDATDKVSCVGNIRPLSLRNHQYELRVAGSHHKISRVNSDIYNQKENVGVEIPREASSATSDHAETVSTSETDSSVISHHRNLASNDNDIMDVMVIYTDEASAWAGGDDAVDLVVRLTVDETNYAFENSLITARLRLVYVAHTTDTSVVEDGDGSSLLNRITVPGDGDFDDDQITRDTIKADLLVLIGGVLDVCGIAYVGVSSAYYATSVSAINCMANSYTFAHEIGHNLGARHDRANTNAGSIPYGYGYCWDIGTPGDCDCHRSVMAYAGCSTLLGCSNCPKAAHFSSPLVQESGSDTGTSNEDNARAINERYSIIAGIYTSEVDGGIIESVSPSRLSYESCGTVDISGWRLGSGSDITSVTLAGVSTSILSQTVDTVTVDTTLTSAPVTGDVVIVSTSRGTTTLSGGFTYDSSDPSTPGELVEDFADGQSHFFVSEGSWEYYQDSCGTACSGAGPTTADGVFARAVHDSEVKPASLTTEMSGGHCLDTVTSISVDYFAISLYDFCFGPDFLTIEVQTVENGPWSEVGRATQRQNDPSDAWLTLSVSGLSSVVYGVRIKSLNDPPSGTSGCASWGDVSIDNIRVDFTTSCGTDCGSVYPTGVPTNVPTDSPTVSPTNAPTGSPSAFPTSPTNFPTTTAVPTVSPTAHPTGTPTVSPTAVPTGSPTESPTGSPTTSPTATPSVAPTVSPTSAPTTSAIPTSIPTISPTSSPTASPTPSPSVSPTATPSAAPSVSPVPTVSPTIAPTKPAPVVICTPGDRSVCSDRGYCSDDGSECVCDDYLHYWPSEQCSTYHSGRELEAGQYCYPDTVDYYCSWMGVCASDGLSCLCFDSEHRSSADRCFSWNPPNIGDGGNSTNATTCMRGDRSYCNDRGYCDDEGEKCICDDYLHYWPSEQCSIRHEGRELGEGQCCFPNTVDQYCSWMGTCDSTGSYCNCQDSEHRTYVDRCLNWYPDASIIVADSLGTRKKTSSTHLRTTGFSKSRDARALLADQAVASFEIFVKSNPDGNTFSITVDQTTSIADLKTMINSQEGIAANTIRLFFAGMEMDDSVTIGYYSITEDSVVQMYSNVCPALPSPPTPSPAVSPPTPAPVLVRNTFAPTPSPSASPVTSNAPTTSPSLSPSLTPTSDPTNSPTSGPTSTRSPTVTQVCTPFDRSFCNNNGYCAVDGGSCVCDDYLHYWPTEKCSTWHNGRELEDGQYCYPDTVDYYCGWLGECSSDGLSCECFDPDHRTSEERCRIWSPVPDLIPIAADGQVCVPDDRAYCNNRGRCSTEGDACVCDDALHYWTSENCATFHHGAELDEGSCCIEDETDYYCSWLGQCTAGGYECVCFDPDHRLPSERCFIYHEVLPTTTPSDACPELLDLPDSDDEPTKSNNGGSGGNSNSSGYLPWVISAVVLVVIGAVIAFVVISRRSGNESSGHQTTKKPSLTFAMDSPMYLEQGESDKPEVRKRGSSIFRKGSSYEAVDDQLPSNLTVVGLNDDVAL